MRGPDPLDHGWWLASRAAGVVALALIAASVILGLAMAGRVARGRPAVKLHEHLALAGLLAIAVHAIALLGDRFLNPGAAGLLVPFAMDHERAFTGLGVVAAYLAALLGLSFYLRRRIGARRWRRLHRLTVLVFVLGVVHALGAGTDAGSAWLRAVLFATGAPVLFLFLLRVLPADEPRPARARPAPRPQPTPDPEAA